MIGCEQCRYWLREIDDQNRPESKNHCININFHRYMKTEYHIDSRRWYLCKQYCGFAKERKPKEKVAA